MKSVSRATALGCLIAVTLAAYVRVLQCGFINYDDPTYASENRYVAMGLTPEGLAYAWTTFDLGNWIPLTWMSLQLDASLFGINPIAFHATNLGLHVVNVLLVFLLLGRLTGSPGKSFAVAALFAVHPLHVESVAWVSERKDVLSTFWLLLTLLAYERYAALGRRRWYLAVLICFLLGLLSKPMLVTVPLLLLLMDVWPLARKVETFDVQGNPIDDARPGIGLLLEKWPLFLLSLVIGVITIAAQDSGRSAFIGADRLSVAVRIGNAMHAYAWYLLKTAFPVGLAVMYPHPLEGLSWPVVAVSAMVLLAMTGLVLIGGRPRRHLLFGWGWFLVSLLPVIGILQVGSQAYADRYSYLPHLGLLVLIVWESAYWLERFSFGRRAMAAVTSLAVLTCFILTTIQVGYWQNSTVLWQHALDVDGTNDIAHYELGTIRLGEDRLDDAYEHFQQVLLRRPYNPEALNNLGYLHQLREEWEQAEDYYMLALRANPNHRRASENLASLRMQHGSHSTSSLVQPPAGPQPVAEAASRNDAGLAFIRQGRMDQALAEFEAALRIDPNYASAHNNAALALTELRRSDEAKQHLIEALRIHPDNPNAHANLAILLEGAGDISGARQHYEQAVRLNPRDLESKQRLRRLTR